MTLPRTHAKRLTDREQSKQTLLGRAKRIAHILSGIPTGSDAWTEDDHRDHVFGADRRLPPGPPPIDPARRAVLLADLAQIAEARRDEALLYGPARPRPVDPPQAIPRGHRLDGTTGDPRSPRSPGPLNSPIHSLRLTGSIQADRGTHQAVANQAAKVISALEIVRTLAQRLLLPQSRSMGGNCPLRAPPMYSLRRCAPVRLALPVRPGVDEPRIGRRAPDPDAHAHAADRAGRVAVRRFRPITGTTHRIRSISPSRASRVQRDQREPRMLRPPRQRWPRPRASSPDRASSSERESRRDRGPVFIRSDPETPPNMARARAHSDPRARAPPRRLDGARIGPRPARLTLGGFDTFGRWRW